MASQVENTTQVSEFSAIDPTSFHLGALKQLEGGVCEIPLTMEDSEFLVGLPHFIAEKIPEVQKTSVNGFMNFHLEEGNTEHIEFVNWLTALEESIVQKIFETQDT